MLGENDSPIKKGVILLGGLAAAAAVFVLAATMLLHSPDPPRVRGEAAKRKEARPARPAGAVVSNSGGWVRPPPPPPAEPVYRSDSKLSRAMDDSNARQLVRTLMQAAATENASLKASMLGAISRSPAALPIVESELSKAGNPAVRTALQEALARSK